jgi:hypothetical protein
MATKAGDPVEAVAEADANGEVAEMFADIRETLGVPVVNLIWRHLAVEPDALAWAWTVLKPAYLSGAVESQALALRHGLAVPQLSGLDSAAMAAAGLSPPDLASIDIIQRSYERSNALNMVALSALISSLDGTVAQVATANANDHTEQPVVGEMPTPLTLEAMPADVAALVSALNGFGGRDDILATMYRHLAHWPPYLSLIHSALLPLARSGALEALIVSAISEGHRRGRHLAADLVVSVPPAAGVRESLTAFTGGPIGKMIAVAALLRGSWSAP